MAQAPRRVQSGRNATSVRAGEVPLSLQQHCYLHLISSLEQFQPERLSLLPQRIRTQLLLLLPATDICYLERTCVVRGIDMDTVWEGVCSRYGSSSIAAGSHRSASLKVKLDYTLTPLVQRLDVKPPSSPLSWKEYFFMVLYSILLHSSAISLADVDFMMGIRASRETYCHRSYILALQMLFCINLFTDVRFYSCLPVLLYGKLVALERYAAFVGSSKPPLSVVQLMRFIFKWCSMHPRALTVDCMSFALGDLWLGIDGSSTNSSVLQELVSEVREVEFHTNKVEGKFAGRNFIHFLLQTMLDVSDQKLESLVLNVSSPPLVPTVASTARHDNCIKRLLKSILHEIVSLFSDTPSENHTVYSLVMMPGEDVSPYEGLKNLEISASYKVERSAACVLTDEHFLQVVQNQKQLQSLHLSGWSERSSKPDFYSRLASLCQLPHTTPSLASIHFSDIDLPSSFVKDFIQAFLSSPSADQKLILHSVYMYDEAGGECVAQFPLLQDWRLANTQQKLLRLSSMYIPNDFISWLGRLPAFHLSSLQLSDIQYDPDMMPGGILGALGRKQDCSIESVTLQSHTVDCPCEGLELLLQKACLLHLELEGAKQELLESLVTGLRRQASVGCLKTLAIKKTQFIAMKTFDFQGLVSAAFALPQTAVLTLDFSGSCLSADHLSAIRQLWEDFDERKSLLGLVLRGCACHPVDDVIDILDHKFIQITNS